MPLAPQITNTPSTITPTTFAISGVSYTSTTVTFTATGHTFSAGDVVTVSGIVPSAYNGTYSISSVSGSTFTCANTANVAITTATGTAYKAPANFDLADNDVVYYKDTTDPSPYSGITTFYQSTTPTANAIGDLWFDTGHGNKQYRWDGSSWVAVQDGAIATAQTAATGAQTTADGKNTVTYSTVAPGSTANKVNDLWFVFSGSEVTSQWVGNGGTSWTQTTINGLVVTNIDAGHITTGILDATLVNITTSPSGSNAIKFSGASNSISFKSAGSVIGHIVPMNVGGTAYGILMHYGATADASAGSFPQAYIGSGNIALIANTGINGNYITIDATGGGITLQGGGGINLQPKTGANLLMSNLPGAALNGSSTFRTLVKGAGDVISAGHQIYWGAGSTPSSGTGLVGDIYLSY